MSCLITAPTIKEIEPFIAHLASPTIKIPVELLITGVGSVSTTYSLARQIGLKRPDYMLQVGVAGCFDKSCRPATVVAIEQDVIADLGVIEDKQFKSLFELGLAAPGQTPYKNGWLKNSHAALLKKLPIPKVKGITVNQVTTEKNMQAMFTEKYKPVTESLEGAAFHYVAIMEKIPFLQLRGLSNYVGERNKNKWNLEEAIANVNKELINLLQLL